MLMPIIRLKNKMDDAYGKQDRIGINVSYNYNVAEIHPHKRFTESEAMFCSTLIIPKLAFIVTILDSA